MRKFYKTIICENGFSMSVQASEFNYCSPKNNDGPYSRVEIGFPSKREELIIEWAEDPGDPTETVYPYVPSEIVWDVIIKNGGWKEGELPPLVVGR
jgi:hypothetical protein